MLEIRNLTKTYRTKTGECVKALDNVSVSFPESGMIFILGKSGSGKSTLLNAIGGLDSVDSGEFIIMGKSSKDFVGSDFDAYRNTFIGFIFQEYNVLDEFTVGANIALALELQGKKADNDTINAILAQVDLLNFAKRKPNELSGGQKQRVAIARALVKEPQIIMADEPTGALDSNTGKQIFDTLKELSKEKLVLIVSHDRDFAERYADRIIELSDGQIISDVSKHEMEGKTLNEGIRQVSKHILQIKGGYRLTPEDVEMINEYLAHSPEGIMLSGDNRVNGELRSAVGITESGGTSVFEGTQMEKDVPLKEYDGKKTHFIRSRLPMKNAVRMGASGLKHKKFRLVLTILLSMVAFAMFGLSDTMAAYDKITATTNSIMDGNVNAAAVGIAVRHTYHYPDEDYTYYHNDAMNDADIAKLREQTGIGFVPVFNGSSYANYGSNFSVDKMMASRDYQCDAYRAALYGFAHLTEQDIGNAGMTLAGRLPSNQWEIAIPEFLYRQFNIAGFDNKDFNEFVAKNQLTMDAAGGANSIIGKHLTVNWFNGNTEQNYEIVGVVDTKFDYDRYEKFLPSDRATTGGGLTDIVLAMELSDTLAYGFHTLGYVTESTLADFAQYMQKNSYGQEIGEYIGMRTNLFTVYDTQDYYGYLGRMGGSELIPQLPIYWLSGTPRTTLAANEYIISKQQWYDMLSRFELKFDATALNAAATEHLGDLWASYPELVEAGKGTYYQALEEATGEYLNYESDVEEALKGWLKPFLADYFGIGADMSDATYNEARQILFYDLNKEFLNYYQFYRVLLRNACEQTIRESNLLHNEAFLDMLRNFGGYDEEAWQSMTETQRLENATQGYCYYLESGRQNVFGNFTCDEIKLQGTMQYFKAVNISMDEVFSKIIVSVTNWDANGRDITVIEHNDWKIAGLITDDVNSGLIVSDSFCTEVRAFNDANGYYTVTETVAEHESGIWAFAIAPMPKDRATVQKLVELNYAETDLRFEMHNQVVLTLDTFNEFIEIGSKVFLYIGIGFAVFSALLLMNFISISISYKKREIGILRAVGARSSDVFKIFFSESLIIALINFLLAVVAVLTAIFGISRWMYRSGIRVTLLNFGIRQLALMLLVSVGVAAIASFLPVWRIARKKPVDAIKDR